MFSCTSMQHKTKRISTLLVTNRKPGLPLIIAAVQYWSAWGYSVKTNTTQIRATPSSDGDKTA